MKLASVIKTVYQACGTVNKIAQVKAVLQQNSVIINGNSLWAISISPLTVWAEVLGFLHHVNSLARMEKPCCKRHFILRISTVCCTHSVRTAARKPHFQMLRTVNLLTKLTWKWQSRLLKAPMRWGSTVQYIQEALLGNATAGWVNEQSTGSKRSYNRTDSLAATQ